MKKYIIIILINTFLFTEVSSQNYTEVLGRPTDSTITLSILFDQSVNVYWEYGTSPGNYSIITPVYKTIADTPLEVDFINCKYVVPVISNRRYCLLLTPQSLIDERITNEAGNHQ